MPLSCGSRGQRRAKSRYTSTHLPPPAPPQPLRAAAPARNAPTKSSGVQKHPQGTRKKRQGRGSRAGGLQGQGCQHLPPGQGGGSEIPQPKALCSKVSPTALENLIFYSRGRGRQRGNTSNPGQQRGKLRHRAILYINMYFKRSTPLKIDLPTRPDTAALLRYSPSSTPAGHLAWKSQDDSYGL